MCGPGIGLFEFLTALSLSYMPQLSLLALPSRPPLYSNLLSVAQQKMVIY